MQSTKSNSKLNFLRLIIFKIDTLAVAAVVKVMAAVVVAAAAVAAQ